MSQPVSSMLMIQQAYGSPDWITWLAERAGHSKVYPGRLEGPGGKAERGEAPIQCAQRELFEETGLKLPSTRFVPCGELKCRRAPNFDVDVTMYLVILADGEVPQDTEPTKRGPWRRYVLDNRRSVPLSEMTIVTATLYRVALINAGLER